MRSASIRCRKVPESSLTATTPSSTSSKLKENSVFDGKLSGRVSKIDKTATDAAKDDVEALLAGCVAPAKARTFFSLDEYEKGVSVLRSILDVEGGGVPKAG
jgi:hypothetical protein